MGTIGGAASNLRQRPHFSDAIRRSLAIPGHQNRSCIREAERRCLGVPPQVATIHCRTAVPLGHHKLKDGLLGRSDMGLAIQEAVLRSIASWP